jgi:hypothetical protein
MSSAKRVVVVMVVVIGFPPRRCRLSIRPFALTEF